MKKLLDIPDQIVDLSKIKAVQSGKSWKKYLEDLICFDAHKKLKK